MKKMIFYVITVGVMVALAALCMVFTDSQETDVNIDFLKSYGWEVKPEYIERTQVIIPMKFDKVYENYNELQTIAGLDLTPYRGKRCVRYTYIVRNFPDCSDNRVRANVLCYNSSPIAGDVMTVDLDGFMYSLAYLSLGK